MSAVFWLLLISFCLSQQIHRLHEANKIKAKHTRAHRHAHTHSQKPNKHISTHCYSFVLSEINRDSWYRDEKLVRYRSCCFLQVWRTKLLYKPTHLHQTHSVCFPACLHLLLLLPASPHFHSSLLSLFPILVDTLQLKVASDECSFEASWAVGTSKRVLYICGFLVKLQISPLSKHLHCLRLYPYTTWWLAGIIYFFLPSISPLALQSLSTDGVLVIINNLGKTYYGVGARVKREKVRE